MTIKITFAFKRSSDALGQRAASGSPPPRRARFFSLVRAAASLVVLAVIFAAPLAFAQAGAAADPSTTVVLSVPSGSWLVLVLGLLGVVLAWYQKYLQAGTHAKLDAIANDTTKSKPLRTLAQIAEELEPLIVSGTGHALADVQAAAAAGGSTDQVAQGIAEDVVDGMSDGLKAEAQKYLGTAGGAIVDFVLGIVKTKLHALQTTKVVAATTAGAVAAAVASSSGPAAVAALNVPKPG